MSFSEATLITGPFGDPVGLGNTIGAVTCVSP
jgi:hypothetical protein